MSGSNEKLIYRVNGLKMLVELYGLLDTPLKAPESLICSNAEKDVNRNWKQEWETIEACRDGDRKAFKSWQSGEVLD